MGESFVSQVICWGCSQLSFPERSLGQCTTQHALAVYHNHCRCLQEYLSTYPGTALTAWRQRIREHDMTTARCVWGSTQWEGTPLAVCTPLAACISLRVHLIASVPGAHASLNMLRWGHFKLRAVSNYVIA